VYIAAVLVASALSVPFFVTLIISPSLSMSNPTPRLNTDVVLRPQPGNPRNAKARTPKARTAKVCTAKARPRSKRSFNLKYMVWTFVVIQVLFWVSVCFVSILCLAKWIPQYGEQALDFVLFLLALFGYCVCNSVSWRNLMLIDIWISWIS
jgi:hypothetical protein